jgi:hypothetical protein
VTTQLIKIMQSLCSRLRVGGLIFLCAAAPGFGQFRVVPNTVQSAEGGAFHILSVTAGEQHFALRQPSGFTFHVDPASKSLFFKSVDEKTAITVRATTNFPGELPPHDVLQAKALADTPGAALLQSSTCPTGYKPGLFFDLVRLQREGLSVRYRHVYVACPEGTVEFIFGADNADFERKRPIFSALVNSFHLETGKSAPSTPANR